MGDTTSEQTEEQDVEPAESATQPADKTLTQADVDRIVAKRLAQQKREHFADYDDLKAAAAELKDIKDAGKSEQQKLNDQITTLQKQLADKDAEIAQASLVSLRATVAADKGVPASSLSGTTKEELEISANELLAWRDSMKSNRKSPGPAGLRSGASNSGDTSANPQERAAAALRELRRGGA